MSGRLPSRFLDGIVRLAFILLRRPMPGEDEPAGVQRPIVDILAIPVRTPVAWGLLAISASCAGAAAYWVNSDPTLQPWPSLLIWTASIGLLLAGAWRLTAPRPTIAPAATSSARWEVAVLLALTALALGLRIVALDRIPLNFGGDEGEMGMVARAVISGAVRDPFATSWFSHPTLWFFLQAFSLQIFGDTVFGLRMLSALIGTAAVPALYLFARPLYGRPAAFGAATLLAVYHFHIHFSRLGVNNIVDPLAALIAFTAFLHGWRTRSPFSFALAGVTLGLAQHFYMGSRLAPLVVAAALLHQLLIDRRRLWGLRWHIGLMVLGFLLGIGPLLIYFITHPHDFTARLKVVGIFQTGWFDQRRSQGVSTLQIALSQARDSFGAWTFQPDRSAFYDPKIPLLDPSSSLLFLLGLAITIVRWRRLDAAMLIAWLVGVGVFGGMIMVNPPESPRYVTSTPVVCLFIALAIVELGALVHRSRTLGRRAAWGMTAAVGLLALWNVNFYFREYTPRNTYGWFNTEIGTTIGRYLQQQPDPVFVYFFGPPRMFYGNGAIRFIAAGVHGVDVLQPITTAAELQPPPKGLRPIFIFLTERVGELRAVQDRYSVGTLQHVVAHSQDTTLLLIYEPKPTTPLADVPLNVATPAPPTAHDHSATTKEDTLVTISVLDNNQSAGDNSLAVHIDTPPAHGAALVNDDRTITYTPNANFNGSDTFTYTVNDAAADSQPATVSITVKPVNDAPSFSRGPDVTVQEGSGPYSAAWAADISAEPAADSGQTLTFVVISNNHPELFSVGPAIAPDGTLTFTPAPNANGSARIKVVLHDSGAVADDGVDTSAPQTFVISVAPQ